MKDKKLIYAMQNIDDDLICEAARRRTADTEQTDDGVRAVYISGKKKIHHWKNAAVIVILLAAAGGTAFIVNYSGVIQGQLPVASDETGNQTNEAEITETAAEEKTEPSAYSKPLEEIGKIVPIKVLDIIDDRPFVDELDRKNQMVYVDSFPQIPQPDPDEKYFTPMSTLELFEYYGFHEKISSTIEGIFREITDENIRHGIYNYPDGSVYDINTFSFERDDGFSTANKITLTLSKKTAFGTEYTNYLQEEGIFTGSGITDFFDETSDTFYNIRQINDITVLSFGNVYEMTDDQNMINDLKNYYEDSPEDRRYKMLGLLDHTMYQFRLFYPYYLNNSNEWYKDTKQLDVMFP
ncbi:MAG: hypothetical protein HDT44_03960 [Ruminococcaceae bacterium]|nr:hypothetical protein [Oscillospiraceae bacterium]